MQTRYMQRTNSKRIADDRGDGDDQPERKRPTLSSSIVEAVNLDHLQNLCSSLEPILRRVVSEEVERALARVAPSRLSGRVSPKRIEGENLRDLQLQFRTKLSLPLFTGGKVEGEQGAAIHVAVYDVNTNQYVTTGPEANMKLDIVVLEGDFAYEDDEDWSKQEFEKRILREREGKRPLLTGDVQVTLKEGIGTLGNLTFTDNSSWVKSRKFSLGVKVSPGYCEETRIREGKTESFIVKDHRGELYKKHYPPSLNDDVWRLEKIGKDGSFHKRLNANDIFTVESFLRFLMKDSANLRAILGSGMSNKMWDVLLEHAKTCVITEKVYVYYADVSRHDGVIFNHVYSLCGLLSGDVYQSVDSLSDEQKVYVDFLVKKAYENWNHVVEFDGKSHVSRGVSYLGSQYMRLGGNENGLMGLGLGRGPGEESSSVYQSGPRSNLLEEWPSEGMELLTTEEEIRMRSNEMLGNEDMQQLLRLFGMGGQGHVESGYGPGEGPTSRCGGRRAVVGWLKIKAAMRWGFFIRKKAAERRAQIVDLDDC